MRGWTVWAVVLVSMALMATLRAQELAVDASGNARVLRYGGQVTLEIGVPQVVAGGFEAIYRFPGQSSPAEGETVKTDGGHGQWKEVITRTGEGLNIRYEFELPADTKATRVQWGWRLDPAGWAGAMATGTQGAAGQPEKVFAVRPLEGMQVGDLRQITLARAGEDIVVNCRASEGAWACRETRGQGGRAYRLEYTRPVEANGKRGGWFEVSLQARKAENPLVALTAGEAVRAGGLEFHRGPLLDTVNAPLGSLVFLHAVAETLPPGQAGGEVVLTYSDGATQTIRFNSGEAFTSPVDDPHGVLNGRLAVLPDKTVAWVSQWANPRPEVPVQRIEARTLAGGWRLLAASGTKASAASHRAEMALRGDAALLAQETVISLDGTWQFSAEGVQARDIPVPAFWERQPGLQGVHLGVYRREFDLPAGLAGQRIAVRFDAVGDAAEVWVNGKMAGREVSPGLPFEVDITPLVAVPSKGNKLEVRVQDDTHFGIAIDAPAWRAAKHWIPRGMGTGNRKGLYQSVSLRARPAVHVSDVQVQTSVRKGEITAIYTVRNTGKTTVKARIAASVHPVNGGSAVLTLPAVDVELPGYVATQVIAKGPFKDVELWQPDHPTLYSLRTLLLDGEKRLERVDTRFGFREVWFEGRDFYLNGIRCNLRGESPAYPEKWEMMSTRAVAAEMIQKYQAVNFNVLRFHAMPAPPHVLELCDEMGMLVIGESAIYASWNMLLPDHPEFMANCREHLVRWVRRDRNHPSVIMWSADNEGLNVNLFTPAQLAEWRKVVDAEDGTRPVTFDGDGSAMGASQASVKHYVRTVADLKDRGGVASGYARDLRNDIYWATEFEQDFPLGCGEFLYPEGRQRTRERELAYMMGLQTRGYRLANWFDIRPYNPSMIGFLSKEGTKPGFEEAYEIIRKSFAAVAVFDKGYDALGPYPAKPELPAGQAATRDLIVYNDEFAGETVEVEWVAHQGEKQVGGERMTKTIPLGGHIVFPIQFVPTAPGELKLELVSRKGGKETFRDVREFVVR